MRLSSFMLVLILFSSLALATTVTVDKLSYAVDEMVKISGTCTAPSISVGLQAGIGLNTVWVEQVTAGSDNKFSASFFPPQAGNYALYASCKGENSAAKNFEVGESVEDMPTLCSESWNCTDWSACSNGIQERNCNDANECGTVSSKPATQQSCGGAPSSSGSGSGGGGGGGWACAANWSCAPWEQAYCNASLIKSRVCVDLKGCEKEKSETINCTACDESWICSQWSSCQNGQQTRSCAEEHKCGTAKLKPALARKCEAKAVAAPVAGKTAPPPKTPVSGKELLKEVTSGFWGSYKFYILGLAGFLILAVIAVLLVLYLRKPKRAYNLDELKEWVKQEKQAGTSDADIKTILMQNTGWKEQEIRQALGGFGA